MNTAFTRTKAWLSFTEVLCLVFFISLICAFRAVTSICISTMILAGFIQNKPTSVKLWNAEPVNQFISGCIFFFFWQTVSLIYTTNIHDGLNDTRLKSGLLFTPFLILFLKKISAEDTERLFLCYCIELLVASLYLLCFAFFNYLNGKNINVFFYHSLVSPFEYHAVYFSILVFIAIVFLFENIISRKNTLHKPFQISLLLFFSFILFLLSSKLVISFYILYVLFLLFTWSSKNELSKLFTYTTAVLVTFGLSFIIVTKNPIGYRFRDFASGNLSLITQNKFSPSVYFNGLQFRLLQWKLVPQILNQHHCWWTGVSTGDAQSMLNEKYISLNMYQGEAGKPGTGYLNYNTHNQLLQSLLQSGIPGALIFIFICASLIRMIWVVKKRLFSFTVILLLVYLFVESLFQEQYGLVIFIFWPLFVSQLYKKNSVSSNAINN